MDMKDRLMQIIAYRTGGRQTAFADLMGWSPQYLAKLVRGSNFGLQPVVRILEMLPEIDARWLILGEGDMLGVGRLCGYQSRVASRLDEILSLERFLPYMDAEEVGLFSSAVAGGPVPSFGAGRMREWEARLGADSAERDRRFAEAASKSDELCKVRTARR